MYGEEQDTFRGSWDGQEKVETPTGGISGYVWDDAAVETLPTLACVYVAQRVPYLLSDATLGFGRGHLELDLEQVEGVHAEDGGDACTETCRGMVLQRVSVEKQRDGGRTRAVDGKKLGWLVIHKGKTQRASYITHFYSTCDRRGGGPFQTCRACRLVHSRTFRVLFSSNSHVVPFSIHAHSSPRPLPLRPCVRRTTSTSHLHPTGAWTAPTRRHRTRRLCALRVQFHLRPSQRRDQFGASSSPRPGSNASSLLLGLFCAPADRDTQGCPLTACCTTTFENQYYNCLDCVGTADATNFTAAQNSLNRTSDGPLVRYH